MDDIAIEFNVPELENASEVMVKDDNTDYKALSVLNIMSEIVERTDNAQLMELALDRARKPVDELASRLELSPIEVILLSIFVNEWDEYSIDIRDIKRHMDMNNLEMLKYSNELDSLVKKGYIRYGRDCGRKSYTIPDDVIFALQKGRKYTKPSIEGMDKFELFDESLNYFKDISDGRISNEQLYENLKDLVVANPKLGFCKKIRQYNVFNETYEDEQLNSYTLTTMMFFCANLVNGNECLTTSDLSDIIKDKNALRYLKSLLATKNHPLILKGYIEEKSVGSMAQKGIYCVSEEAKRVLLCDFDFEDKAHKKGNFIQPSHIIEKPLFYNESDKNEVARLKELLSAKKFPGIQKRLAENGMRKGFSCLFYGGPGTGKTETVYQIAKASGRELMVVSVDKIMDKWVGESEKNVKRTFEEYRLLCEKSKLTPIMLFNEADAIFSRRFEETERTVDQMSNAVQNLLLQEMEDLDGILIATTNLTCNLDKAFERRFLYKVEFHKPDISAKCKIWKSMIPSLSEEDASILANKFEFSGGQIENISRKMIVNYALDGTKPSLASIQESCFHETINTPSNSHKKIGF